MRRKGRCDCARRNAGVFTPVGPAQLATMVVDDTRSPEGETPGAIFDVRCSRCGQRWEVYYDPFGYHQAGYCWQRVE
jgi:hypothetical protein